MYGYIYMTTNIINNHKYIGKHASEKVRKTQKFDESYIGSGKRLLKAINKYGIENFICELIEWCETESELNVREKYWISYYHAVEDDSFYNISDGGDGHCCEPWNKGKVGVQETTQKQLDALERGRHLPASDKLKQQLSNYRKNVVVSDSTKQKLSENQKGRKVMNNGIENKYFKPEQFEQKLSEGWVFGQKPKDRTEQIKKLKTTLKNKKLNSTKKFND